MTKLAKSIDPKKFASVAKQLAHDIRAAIDKEIEDCQFPELKSDPMSGALWSSLPLVDSKTAHKISASLIEQQLGVKFHPTWIRRGGYNSSTEAAAHVIEELKKHYVVDSSPVAA
jgi:hypothetical protein